MRHATQGLHVCTTHTTPGLQDSHKGRADMRNKFCLGKPITSDYRFVWDGKLPLKCFGSRPKRRQ
eukprot:2681397-Amphidinium_carterae.2